MGSGEDSVSFEVNGIRENMVLIVKYHIEYMNYVLITSF